MEVSSGRVGFFKKEGLLYRRWTPPGRDEDEMSIEQLVLPQKCRETVLQFAHKVPLAGHMGNTKMARILHRFYWPSLFKDVADCKCYQERQKCSIRRAEHLLCHCHQWRIAMDIIGPLPRSRSRYQYILVISMQLDNWKLFPYVVLMLLRS